MAIVRGNKSNETDTSSSTPATSWTTAPTAGSKVWVVIWGSSGADPTSVVDNGSPSRTFVKAASSLDGGSGTGSCWVFYADNVQPSGTYTVTVTFASAFATSVGGMADTGVATGDPEATNTNTGTSTSASSGAVTGTGVEDLYVACMVNDANGPNSITIGGGFTEQFELADGTTFDEGAGADQIGVTGSQTASWTLGLSRHWRSCIACWKAAAVGGTQPAPSRSRMAQPGLFWLRAQMPFMSQQRWTTGVSGPRSLSQSLSATLSFAGSGPTNAITKGLAAAALSFTGAQTRAITKGLAAAALSFVGAITKLTSKGLAGATLSFVGSIPSRSIGKLVSGGLSFTGSGPRNAITKGLAAAALSFTGAITRAITKATFTATLSFTGTIVSGKQFVRALTAALSFTGSIPSRLIGKNVTGALSFTGSGPVRAITKGLSTALSFTGAQARAITKGLAAAALSFTGALVSGKQFARSLTATLSFTGSGPQRAIVKGLTANLSFVGGVGKAIQKGLAGALGFLGSLVGIKSGAATGPGSVQVFIVDAFPTKAFLSDAFPAQAFLADAFPVKVFITDIFGGSMAFYVGKAVVLSNWLNPTMNPALALTGGFRNRSGTLYDPPSPALKYRLAGQAEVTISGGGLTHDGLGLYSATVTPTVDGDLAVTAVSGDGAYADVVTVKIENAPL